MWTYFKLANAWSNWTIKTLELLQQQHPRALFFCLCCWFWTVTSKELRLPLEPQRFHEISTCYFFFFFFFFFFSLSFFFDFLSQNLKYKTDVLVRYIIRVKLSLNLVLVVLRKEWKKFKWSREFLSESISLQPVIF